MFLSCVQGTFSHTHPSIIFLNHNVNIEPSDVNIDLFTEILFITKGQTNIRNLYLTDIIINFKKYDVYSNEGFGTTSLLLR